MVNLWTVSVQVYCGGSFTDSSNYFFRTLPGFIVGKGKSVRKRLHITFKRLVLGRQMSVKSAAPPLWLWQHAACSCTSWKVHIIWWLLSARRCYLCLHIFHAAICCNRVYTNRSESMHLTPVHLFLNKCEKFVAHVIMSERKYHRHVLR